MPDLVTDSLCVIEKDNNGDILISWVFPALDEDVEQVLKARSNLSQETIPLQFTYSKYKNFWIYIYSQVVERDSSTPANLNRVSVYSLCILRNTFNPEKYLALAKLMSAIYSATGDPAKLLQCHLGVFTKNQYDGGKFGKFVDAEYDNRRAFLVSPLKDIVRLFGEETILLWIAMLTKKRIIVYSDKLVALQKVIRAIPLLVWHRQNWNILRPYVTLSQNEVSEMMASGVYVAGFTDPVLKSKENTYDLYVDINARTISIASHAKDHFTLANFHNDLASFLVSSAEDEETTDQTLIKNLTMKTKDLITKLENLKVEDPEDKRMYITLEGLQSRKLPPGMDRFLYGVSAAEGLTKSS
jgi:hypothetical protein